MYDKSDNYASGAFNKIVLDNALVELKYGSMWNESNDYMNFTFENTLPTEIRPDIFKNGLYNRIGMAREHIFRKYSCFLEGGITTFYDKTVSWSEFQVDVQLGFSAQYSSYTFLWASLVQQGLSTQAEIGFEKLYVHHSIEMNIIAEVFGDTKLFAVSMKYQFY